MAESSFELVSLFAGGQRAPHNTLQYSTITSDRDLSGTGSELRQIQQDLKKQSMAKLSANDTIISDLDLSGIGSGSELKLIQQD